MSCKTCKKGCQSNKPRCPLCGRTTYSVVAEEVYNLIKEEVRPHVYGDRFQLCDNEECEVVFYSVNTEQMILAQDIDRGNMHRENIKSTNEEQ